MTTLTQHQINELKHMFIGRKVVGFWYDEDKDCFVFKFDIGVASVRFADHDDRVETLFGRRKTDAPVTFFTEAGLVIVMCLAIAAGLLIV